MTPSQVAEALIVGLRREKAEILVGWQSHLAVWCQRFTPWLMERILQITSPPRAVSFSQKFSNTGN